MRYFAYVCILFRYLTYSIVKLQMLSKDISISFIEKSSEKHRGAITVLF
uniref:Uncharacterized protein n=1 Tax=Siphoviridae sp. ct7EW56 TaxID=2827562 RepID=A0A8S5LS17_9CAUD|nr:MAG TPA: hypothetical protein [Siphoviridae sp. ct7EW56]